MTTDFPTAPSAYGLKGPSATGTVEKSIHASHTKKLTPPKESPMLEVSWLLFAVASLVGLGAVLRTSEWLFLALKLVGAAYLVYLGIQLLRSSPQVLAISSGAPRSLSRLFLNGALSNISNPKVAIFYFAFLPQFVSPGAAHPTLSVFALGLTFAALTFLVKGPVGFSAGMLSGWLRSRPGFLTWLYRTSGVILIGLGVKLALERRA